MFATAVNHHCLHAVNATRYFTRDTPKTLYCWLNTTLHWLLPFPSLCIWNIWTNTEIYIEII